MRFRSLLTALVLGLLAACSGPASPSGIGDPVLVGAGDIGWCGMPGAQQTARLLDDLPGTVFTAGDNAYPLGSATDYRDCYDPFWGRHLARTRPSPGNHDYNTPGATAYFEYYGERAGPAGVGYYDYMLGSWHIIVLNSNVSMSSGSTQDQWLRGVLESAPTACTLAYWHHPLFSSSEHGNDARSIDAWRVLQATGVDVVVNGHDHVYERFAPQSPDGVPYPQGIRQFTVGTGGAPLYAFFVVRPNSEFRYNDSVGILKLTLRDGRYSWAFVTPGAVVDAGSAPCR